MRMRPLVLSMLLGTSSVMILAGCSGKPENSPVIRKKFAEVDKMQENLDSLIAEAALLNEQVRQLTEENKELRAFMPDVDGMPVLEKVSTLESRLNKLEGLAADRMVSQATSSTRSSSSSKGAAEAPKLEDSPLAGQAEKTVAAQQQTKPAEQAASSPSDSFKKMTNQPTRSAAPAQKAKPAAKRGAYHVIESGDSLESIAKKHGTSIDSIVKANRLPSAKIRLARGQRLYIPGS